LLRSARNDEVIGDMTTPNLDRHPGEGRDLAGASKRHDEIPAFAGMTDGG
jgi:hypothetical protein